MVTWWHHYWNWVGGNIGAMPLQALITVIVTLLLGRPISRLWRRLVGERADIEDVKRMAAAAQRITADLFEHHTGERHPDAPGMTARKGGTGDDDGAGTRGKPA